MRSLICLLLLSSPVWCQFVEFAATDDGHQVYFTTSMVERNAPADTWPELRVFRVDGRTFQLFAERGGLAGTDGFGSGDGISSVQVTGDGRSVAMILSSVCPTEEPCNLTVRRAEIRGRGAQVLGEANRVLLSRNGQWALLVPPPVGRPMPGLPPLQNTQSTLVNLSTGERIQVGMPATLDGSLALASDGSLFARVQNGPTAIQVGVWKNGQLTPVPTVSGGISFIGMSDDARTLLASRIALPAPGQPPPTELPLPDLIAFDLEGRTSRVVHSLKQPGRYILLGLSKEGRIALLRTLDQNGNGPALLFNLNSGRLVTLTLPNGEVPVAGTLSGYGNVAFLGTSSGRILRILIDANGNPAPVDELIPATPYFAADTPLAPGGLINVAAPVAGDIDWTNRILLSSRPLAIVSRAGNRITAQVPWDLSVGMAPIRVDYPSDSPLVQRENVFIAPNSPRPSEPPPGATGVFDVRLIKGDFSGYVTEPLKAGDIVHMYWTGLGAVQGPMQTGQPAPLDDLRPLAGYVHCRFMLYPSDAETLFAGLAPGLIGIYQLTFRLGADTPPNVALSGMECGFNNPGCNFVFRMLMTPP